MGLGFRSYIVENDEAFARAVLRAGATAKNLRVPFAQIAKDFRKSRTAIFTLQKAPSGWDDLNPRYKDIKKQQVGFVYPILRLTGRLEKSVTDESHPENITRIFPQFMHLGTGVPYGRNHQEGIGVPLRKFLFIGPESVKFANSDITGFPERSLNTLNSFVLRSLGANIEEATGVKPKIKQPRAKI